MGKIRIMTDALASQVAAGEVVERPASVVKELIENSLDAGATRIEVRVDRGGASLIRVSDNGGGMDYEDALLALERHATSKIRVKEDLSRIVTRGFRGEALPSIASVSRFRLHTRQAEALAGTEILMEGGKLTQVRESGEGLGTVVEARALFYNLPARRKFLRTEATEFAHVESQFRLQALARPDVFFSLYHQERMVLQIPPSARLLERVRDLAGQELAARLLEIEPQEIGGIRVTGCLGAPGVSRGDRSQQLVFLNRRPVDSAILSHGLREGYHNALMKGQYPVVYLFLDMPPEEFDINVHPAKKEVRFRDGFRVRQAVAEVVAQTLEKAVSATRPALIGGGFARATAPAPAAYAPGPRLDAREEPATPHAPAATAPFVPQPWFSPQWPLPEGGLALRRDWSGPDEQKTEEVPSLKSEVQSQEGKPAVEEPTKLVPAIPKPAAPVSPAAEFRLIGVLNRLYVLMEGKDGLVLMDQHAAHERVLYEQLKKRWEAHDIPAQRLLMPHSMEVDPREFDLIRQNQEALARFGLGIEPFGRNTIKIDSVPAFLKAVDPLELLNQLLEELKTLSARTSKVRLGEDLVATTVCRQAVKANDLLSGAELQKLLEDLFACDMPYCCPHGRPTLVQISLAELDRKFGRRV